MLNLLEELESTTATEPNEVQTGSQENGYSCAIVILAVLLLESALNRTRFIRNDNASEHRAASAYFAHISSDRELAESITEVFALRDAIAHNHLWKADVYWDDAGKLRFGSPPKLLEGYGDKRLHRVMDSDTRRSHILGLDLFPPRIWRRDAYLTLNVVFKALEALEEMDRNYFYISPQHFMYQNKLLSLKQIMNALSRRDDL